MKQTRAVNMLSEGNKRAALTRRLYAGDPARTTKKNVVPIESLSAFISLLS